MSFLSRIGFGLLALSFVTASGSHAQDCPPKPLATSDLTLQNGHVLIDARVNGTNETFLLDTGAALSALRDNVIDMLGIPRSPIPLDQISDAEGRAFTQAASVQSFELGGINLGAVQMLVAPRPEKADLGDAGIIGADLLHRYDIDLDLPKQKLTLFEAGHCLPAGAFKDEHYTSLPLRIEPGEHLYLPVTLDGKNIEALIDTGAAASVLTLDALHRRFGLSKDSDGVQFAGSITGANRGVMGAYRYAFRQLSLSDVQLEDPTIVLIADETRRVRRITPTGVQDAGLPDLILGMSELAKMHLYISYANGMIYLAKP